MLEPWGIFKSAGELVRGDDSSWRFYNRYVDEPADAEPYIFTTRREADEMAVFNLIEFGHRRLGLVIIKPKGGARG